ncbi:cupin domain-containing protein [Halobacteria archaeon AArc-curdl1]|uniref:Cupin domain-containing protein n=1 Tax=Natronosalvus hydrolyticus TaxID=2979988 RepID=A0AAP2Z5J5_9EURY|nr:cupin domain-containing protein [Halobacteria archaeon AArc-curdl1]
MTDDTGFIDGISRRTALQASAAGLGAVGLSGAVTAQEDENDDGDTDNDDEDDTDVDEPDGFEVEVVGEHATFPNEVGTTFALMFADEDDDDDGGTMGSHHTLDDESTLVVADVTWEPGGTSGWHRHPGSALVNIVEGELEVTWERDCLTRTYAAGEGFFDPGEVHIADNVSEANEVQAWVIFLGVPDGEPATEWVEPVDC